MITIRSAKFEISNPDYKKCPDVTVPEYAFIGRSNVGKSSLINMLVGKKGLAKTSQTPGKTLLINHFSINQGEWYIVDLPGYGYAARGKAQRDALKKLIDEYILYREQMTLLFVLIDIRHAPQKVDLEFFDWIGENGIPFAIIFTKSDKLGPVAAQRNVDEYKRRLLTQWEELPPIFVTSSERGSGRDELLAYIEDVNADVAAAKAEE
jgi:GTP-binding protein